MKNINNLENVNFVAVEQNAPATVVANSNYATSASADAAATTVAPNYNKAIKRWKKGLALAMKGNLWYKHLDFKSGVTSDTHINEYTSYDVLCASTREDTMLQRGFTKATNLLCTFLRLLEESNDLFIEEDVNCIMVKYNTRVYTKCYI